MDRKVRRSVSEKCSMRQERIICNRFLKRLPVKEVEDPNGDFMMIYFSSALARASLYILSMVS